MIRPGHVYALLLLNGYQVGNVKIGFTTRDIEQRAREIVKLTYATDAEVLCAIQGTARTERYLHWIFRKYCEVGPTEAGHEWFALPNRHTKRLRRLGGFRNYRMSVPLTPTRAENARRMGQYFREAS